jgi:glycosidase
MGVFNHTGRHFFAFKNLQQNGWNSSYKDWYLNVDFSRKSCFGDNFDYEGWAGCKDLVKLNLKNEEVRNHIFAAIDFWIDSFKIDGLRLDAADVISKDFLDALNSHCKNKKSDFWLMGEVVHGDYNDWAKPGRLDSVTNETFAFARSYNNEKILVAVNASTEEEVSIGKNHWGYGANLLTGEKIQFAEKVFVPGNWVFVVKVNDCR